MRPFYLFLISFHLIFHPFALSQDTEVKPENNKEMIAESENGNLEKIPMTKRNFALVTGRSHLMKFVHKFSRISVSDPEVVDFLILGPTEVLLNAKKEGAVNLIVWDYKNDISVFDISVTKDPSLLEDVLKKIDPQGKFQIYPSKDVFVVKGESSTVARAKEVEKAANAFAEGSVSLVDVKDPKQILLQIRFVQIDRGQDFDFGLDMEFDSDHGVENVLQRFLPGTTNATATNPGQTVSSSGESVVNFRNDPNALVTTQAFDIFDRNTTDIYQLSVIQSNRIFLGYLKALEAKGVVKTIARPNLLARDGEEATFLVGGEAAIVTSTEDSVNVQYKEFGTRLKFTPEILSDGKIKLAIEPEVSSLNQANGVTVGNTEVPGFTTTKIKSLVVLQENETFMVGGLIQQKMTSTESGFPFMRRIPVFGKLFESTDYEWDDVELLILVTPKIIQSEKLPLPAKSEEHDILSKATDLMKFPIDDDHGEAVKMYLTEQKRFEDHLKDGKVPVVELKQNPVKHQTPKTDLDGLESALQWKKTGEVV